ncbi:LuxR C-terminal-related transcriptional regulator [Streptomyces sp. NPDC002044]|uniref:LuxR C-terminal-related transcriptional regulator n=1 Tax=Streptomyces sp. NPDC002044 TaxID=3154662 RepID=UPI00332FB3C8
MNRAQTTSLACNCDISSSDGTCSSALNVYRALSTGPLPREQVPACLWELNLATEEPDAPDRAMVVPPTTAAHLILGPLQATVDEGQLRLRTANALFSHFTDVYTEARRDEQPPLTLLSGGELISRTLEAAVDGCREELLTAQPGGGRSAHLLAEALPRDLRLLARGVSQRTIYQHTVRSHPATIAYIGQITESGAEVRTLAEVFERMIICDRETAFIPVSETRRTAALQVRHPALVRLLTRFFDNAWSRSVPVSPDTAPVRSTAATTDMRRAILLAVVSGETDDSIARRLGTSRRTVAEHIRKVSTQLESNSRAQLGYLLATSGMLRDPGDPEPGRLG